MRRTRDLSCGDTRISLEFEVRRVQCKRCGTVKRERLEFLADNPFYYQALCLLRGAALPFGNDQGPGRGAEAGLGYGQGAGDAVHGGAEFHLAKAGRPGPKVVGIDEISIRKGHTYRIVVSDLIRGRPIWFGGADRSEASMGQCYDWLGTRKAAAIRRAVMDMWKPFRNATAAHAPVELQAATLFDKFHIMRHLVRYLGTALDTVRKAEYARLAGRDRRFLKGQQYTLLSHRENLTTQGRRNLKTLLAAN